MKENLKRVFTLAVVMALAVAPAVAAGKGGASRTADDSVASAEFNRDVIVWEPLIEFRQANLRVAGESGVFERSFEAGEAIYFDFIDAAGNRMLDGSYSYELTFSPVIEAFREDDAGAGIEARRSSGQRMTQSGVFTIADGMVAMPDVNEEGISFRTFVDTMDRVVQGSICVGFDCPSNPSFGFDTLRLQENNLRIHFQDTSSSASFPSNDWRLSANDTTNGGANRFSIEDSDTGRLVFTVEAGAPSNSLYVDDAGRIGRKTSTPVVELHIVDGDSPTVRLEQDGSSGFTPQTWDLAGNEANFFVRDVTNGSRLPFKIFPNAPTNSITVEGSTGDVGFSTTSPVDNGITVHGGSANEAVVKLCHNASGCSATGDGANFTLNNSDLFYTNREDGDLFFFTNNLPKMLLDNADNHTITGNLAISGTLSKGGGAFKIDHPLDPANKYLYHSFVESPDMMNIYNGNVKLDASGQAWVEMPDYFQALNREFRYQLTSIGGPAPNLFIAEAIEGNRFKIAGGIPGGEVSWQVTGVRQDPYAEAYRIPTEVDKPLSEKGSYLRPELYDQPQRVESASPAAKAVAEQGSQSKR